MLKRIQRILFILGLICISNITLSQTIWMPPPPIYYPTYNGNGAISVILSSTSAPPNTGPFTVFHGINGSLTHKRINNNNYTDNICVIGKRDEYVTIPSALSIIDTDYVESTNYLGQTSISVAPISHPVYKSTTKFLDYETSITPVGPIHLTGNSPVYLGDISPGKYEISTTVEDKTPTPTGGNGSVVDGNASASIDLYIVDLEEKTRTEELNNNEIREINLKYAPTSFIHEDICYVGVSWGSGIYMPGMPQPASNLYEDAACTTPITGTNGEKLWQIPNVPEKIYYKRPSDAAGYTTITVKMVAKNSSYNVTLVQRKVTFYKRDLKPYEITKNWSWSEYVGSSRKTYTSIWADRNDDGKAIEGFPYNNTSTQDNNRPFIFVSGTKMKFDSLKFKDTSGISYYPYSTSSPNRSYISGTGDLSFGTVNFNNVPFTYSNHILQSTSAVESTAVLPNKVDVLDLSIAWTVKHFENNVDKSKLAGPTNHKVYVTYKTPLISECPNSPCPGLDPDPNPNIPTPPSHPSGHYESLFNISCTAAKGQSTQQDVFDAIWKKVNRCELKTINGTTLQYYGAGASTKRNEDDATVQILRDGDGRCGNWASLFIDLLKSQGIELSYRNDVQAFWLKLSDTYVDSGGPFKYYLHQKTNKFQGNGKPDKVFFQDHVVNMYNNYIYDITGNFDKKSDIDTYLQDYIVIRKHYFELDDKGKIIGVNPNYAEEIPLNSINIFLYIEKP